MRTATNDNHIPLLDGVRAAAIALVFAAHAGLDSFVPGGFGVTAFFFISGYLITTLLRGEFEQTSAIALKKYFTRRVLRLWPPLYIYLAVTAVLCLIRVMPFRVELVPLLSELFHFTNYYQVFGHGNVLPGSGVLWSLAVEEHFYVLYPFILIALLRFDSTRRSAVACIATACVAFLLWRLWLVQHGSPTWRTYKCTDTRADSILYGCLLGLWNNPRLDPIRVGERGCAILLCVGITGLLASFVVRAPFFRETFRYSLQGCSLLMTFYASLAHPGWFAVRWLDWAVLRFIGAISYSMYLFHFTSLTLSRCVLGGGSAKFSVAVVAVAITVVAAVLMYYGIERPCARLRKRLHGNRRVAQLSSTHPKLSVKSEYCPISDFSGLAQES